MYSLVLLLLAQHAHPTQTYDALVGRFYDSWLRPDIRHPDGGRLHSCCNRNDCEPAQVIRKDGKWYVRNHRMAPNRDVPIPENTIESNQVDPRESPDGRTHVCMTPSMGVLCVVMGSEG